MSWLHTAIHDVLKPKHSVIGVLKSHLGGPQQERSMDVVHASDITKIDFCPRKWALYDILDKSQPNQYVMTAMDVTYRMGHLTEQQVVEEWGGDAVVGNWQCRWCNESRTMVPNPGGRCQSGRKHWWQYHQVILDELTTYGVQGGIDALFNLGAPKLIVTEVKTLNPVDFDTILVPLSEHRLRTNLYLWILEHSQHPFRHQINMQEARVLYISRGYGKMNAEWKEILPFKEFVVTRNDADLAEPLLRAKEVQAFRTQGIMPHGICMTALDKFAKKCGVCPQCFSGDYPAGVAK